MFSQAKKIKRQDLYKQSKNRERFTNRKKAEKIKNRKQKKNKKEKNGDGIKRLISPETSRNKDLKKQNIGLVITEIIMVMEKHKIITTTDR